MDFEGELYKDLKALLYPEIGKPLLKIKDFQYSIENFSVTYKGTEESLSKLFPSCKMNFFKRNTDAL